MQKQLTPKTLVLALAMAYAALPGLSLAQEQTQPQQVVITGSNIKRATKETASPVQVMNRQEILQTGAATVRDLLDTVSATGSALSDKAGSNSFASGASGVNLRDLGKSSTLVLINGRRIASFGLADGAQENFANIDTIPVDIIERIEVVKDGASAVYGSDAVAGVINIITRKEFKGLTLRGDMLRSLQNSHLSREQKASVAFGIGELAKEGYNLMGHVELYHRSNYTTRDIIKSVEPWYKRYVNPNYGVRSTYSNPGNFDGYYPDDYADADLAGTRILKARPGCAPENIENGLCRFDQWARDEVIPAADRVNTYFAGRKNLSDNLTLFGELQYSRTKTTYKSAIPLMNAGDESVWFDASTQQARYFQVPSLPVGHPDNPYPFEIGLRYRFSDFESVYKQTTQADQHRVLVGLEGQHFGWDWNAALGNMASDVDVQSRGGRNFLVYPQAVVNGQYRYGGNNSQALMESMFPLTATKGRSSQTFFDIRGSRELMALPGGKLAMASGLELRHETFKMVDSANLLRGEIIGYGSTNIEGSRNLAAAFVEFSAPLAKNFTADFALRADKSTSAPTSFVPKIGARWGATDWLTLRGTYAHGFRAPNLAETGTGNVSAFLNSVNDPKRCATASAIYQAMSDASNPKHSAQDDIDATSVRASGCEASAGVLVTPNPNLEPEKTKSYTLGFIFEPSKNFNMTFDYFHIVRRNEILSPDINQVLATEDQNPGSISRLAISDNDRQWAARYKELTGKDIAFSVGALSSLKQSYVNLARSRRTGVDLEVESKWNLGAAGSLRLGMEASVMLDYRSWDTVTNTYTENLVGNYTHPKLRATGKATWKLGSWTWGSRVNYTSGTRLMDNRYDSAHLIEGDSGCTAQGIDAVDCRVAADTTVDFSVSYDGIRNTTITANLLNAFNRGPMVDVRANGNARGRVVRVGLEYRF
ncbi:TonB-dependent receptor [Massilia sp. W12]|uniref:TonB-dependent receptor domain-containing protein n=1 Tax=Massilia sp. W12 TaxID=3126507 RepID=UPI0030D43DAA